MKRREKRPKAASLLWTEGRCPCEKRLYASRSDAKRAAHQAASHGSPFHAYRCPAGAAGWHVGHLPRIVRQGHESASEHYGRAS